MPEGPSAPPRGLMARLALSDAEPVAATAIATVWRVRGADGTAAALKIYPDADLSNEGPVLDLMAACDHPAMVRIRAREGTAVLMDWLPGPSLGDLSRDGRDDEAARALGGVAAAFHGPGGLRAVPGLPGLDRWFADLDRLVPHPDCPARLRRDVARARDLAHDLLASAPPARPLHGDLHHDNLRHGPAGWTAFDAKGVVGDPGYELANAFRNPKGCGALQRDPARIRRMAAIWSAALGVPRDRLLRWAAAKCALSIAWANRPALRDDAQADLLGVLLGAAGVD